MAGHARRFDALNRVDQPAWEGDFRYLSKIIRVAEVFLCHPHRVFPFLDGVNVAGLLPRSVVRALLTRFG